MEQYLQPILDYLRTHPTMSILFTFLTALIESLPVLGTVFPGSITMTAIGTLIGTAVIAPLGACIAAVSGAFIGDCIGFWLGSRYHEKIRRIWPLNKLGKFFTYGEKFFAKHGGKSIIIGRFVGPTRAAMPLIAGILHYRWKQFLPAAFLAAVLWSLLYMAPGILLGALAMDLSAEDATKVVLLGLAVIASFWLMFWLMQYFFKQLSRAINRQIQNWWKWLNHSQANFLVRLIRNQRHPYDFHQLKLTLLCGLCSLLFLGVWYTIYRHGWLTQFNQPLFYLAQSFRTRAGDHFWALMSVLGTPEALLAASLLIAAALMITREQRAGIHLAVLGLISAGAVAVIKKLSHSPRPTGLVWFDLSSSFPSGHTTISVTILGFLAFLIAKTIPRGWRWLLYLAATMLILLISLSRLLLGQHWLTDIIGGWCLGLSILLLITVSFRRLSKSPFTRPSIVVLGLVIAWLGAGLMEYSKTLWQSQPLWPTIRIPFEMWWRQPLAAIPLYRQNRFGHFSEPFNVQWAGELTDITTFLQSRGWQKLEDHSNWHAALQQLIDPQPEGRGSLLSWLYQNQAPTAFFIKHAPNPQDILELRLWPSGAQYLDSSLPLWLGILTYRTPPEKLLRFPHRHIQLQSGHILVNRPPSQNSLTFQIIHIPKEQQPRRVQILHWDGDVFIMRSDSTTTPPAGSLGDDNNF